MEAVDVWFTLVIFERKIIIMKTNFNFIIAFSYKKKVNLSCMLKNHKKKFYSRKKSDIAIKELQSTVQ